MTRRSRAQRYYWAVEGQAVQPKAKSLRDYLGELEKGKEGRPDQVRQGLEMYIDLWKKAIERGVVSLDDDMESALERVDKGGGLYEVAGG